MGYSVRRRGCCGMGGDDIPPIPDLMQLPVNASIATRGIPAGTVAFSQALIPLCYSPFADAQTRADCANLAKAANVPYNPNATQAKSSAWGQINDWLSKESIKGVKNGYLIAGGGGLIFLAALAGGKRR